MGSLTVYNEARAELQEIMRAGARALKPAGRELLPVKRDMFPFLSDPEANLVLDACELLFAAVLDYENARWQISHATDPISLIEARIQSGRADAVCQSLFHGPTKALLVYALNHAPIAYYALSTAAPDLKIIDRTLST